MGPAPAAAEGGWELEGGGGEGGGRGGGHGASVKRLGCDCRFNERVGRNNGHLQRNPDRNKLKFSTNFDFWTR